MQQKIEQYLRGLTRREQLVLLAVAVCIGLFIIVGGILSPALSYRAKLEKSVVTHDDQLRRIYEIGAQIKAAKGSSANAGSAGLANFTLFGFLEDLAAKGMIKERIEYMKPVGDAAGSVKESVEIKIRAIYQEDLITLLYEIERCPYGLTIKRMNVRRMEKENNLDVIIQVVRYG